MRYIEALDGWDGYYKFNENYSLFLAGGISNCSNWQDKVVSGLKHSPLILLNPRRKNFPMDAPYQSQRQIEWEHQHLQMADAIMFWFCKETLCPITLFEYGKWLVMDKKLFVGCDPEYERLIDVKIQTRLERPMQIVHTDLNDLILEIISY